MTCPHTTKRCARCGLYTGSSCAIEDGEHQDRKATSNHFHRAFMSFERKVYDPDIDTETMELLRDFREE